MKRPILKAVISTAMLLAFLFLAFSGAVLYFGKTGMVLGIARGTLRNAHTIIAALMCVFAVAHFILNLRVYLAELRAMRKQGPGGSGMETEREKRK